MLTAVSCGAVAVMHPVSTFAEKLRMSSSAASTRRMLLAVRSPAWQTMPAQSPDNDVISAYHDVSMPRVPAVFARFLDSE